MTTRAGSPARLGAMSARAKLALLAIVVLAIGLRIAAIAYTHGIVAAPEENRLIAANLAAGRGFTFTEFGITGPTAIRGPVYPIVLAIVGPDRVGLILAINVLAGAGTVLAAFALVGATYMSPTPRVANVPGDIYVAPTTTRPSFAPWVAALLFAIWPTQLYAATVTQGLSIAVFLTLASFTLAWRRTPLALIGAGMLAGLACLTEPVLSPAFVLAALVLGWRKHWPDAALFVGTAMVLVTPWLYRNAVVFGGPMPITSNFWKDVFLASDPESAGSRHIDPRFLAAYGPTASLGQSGHAITTIDLLNPAEYDQLKQPEPERSAAFKSLAISYMTGSYWSFASNASHRFYRTLVGSGLEGSSVEGWSTLHWISRFLPIVALLVLIGARPYLALGRLLVAAMTIGIAIIPALSLVEPRNIVLMDIPQLLAVALVIESVRLARAASVHA